MLTVSIDRWSIMDFTSLVMQETYQLLVPWPEEESRLTAVIRPFHLTVFITSLDKFFKTNSNIFTIYKPDLDINFGH